MKKSSPSISTSKRTRKTAADKLVGYFDDRRVAFLAALEAARLHYAVEGVHQLRVEVKRLRAFYKLIERIAPSFASKPNAETLRDLYRAAGRLRDIDIFQAIANSHLNHLDLREYFNHLKSVELEKRQKFDTVAAGSIEPMLARSRTKLRAALAATGDDRIMRRLGKRVEKLSLRLSRSVGQEHSDHVHLHSVRKLSKRMRYALDVWQLCDQKSRAVRTASELLKLTYGALGEWHDHVVALESLQEFQKEHAGKKFMSPRAYIEFGTLLRREIDQQKRAFEHAKPRLVKSLAGLRVAPDRAARSRPKPSRSTPRSG